MCEENPIHFKKEPDGSYFVNRDWWIFRYLLDYLRNKDLPHKRDTLLQLYNEAAFWKLKVLQSDIYYRLHDMDTKNVYFYMFQLIK